MTDTYRSFEIHPAAANAQFLMICDHATNTVPDIVTGGGLGLPKSDMERHIAFDIGAAAVTRYMASHLSAPAILSKFFAPGD